MRVSMIALFVGAFCLSTARAQDKSRVNVQDVLDKYVQAIGGKAAIQRITSRVSKGTLTVVNPYPACLNIEFDEKLPDRWAKFLTTACTQGLPVGSGGSNGKSSWRDSIFKDGPLAETESESELENVLTYPGLIFKFRELHPDLLLEERRIGKNDVYVLQDPKKDDARWYFDMHTGLLMAYTIGSIELDYLDYKRIDGLLVPHIQRQWSNDSLQTIIRFTEIKHNVPIEERRFSPPSQHGSLDLDNNIRPWLKPQR